MLTKIMRFAILWGCNTNCLERPREEAKPQTDTELLERGMPSEIWTLLMRSLVILNVTW